MKKRLIAIFTAAVMGVTLLAGCSGTGTSGEADKAAGFDASADFEQITEQARGTKVTFYGWGGDDKRNEWLDTVVAS